MQYKTDIEIAQACEKERIGAVAARAGIAEEYIEQYGNYKAKVDYRFLRDPRGHAGRQAHTRDGDYADARGRGQDDDHGRPDGRPA